jgi:hypothetical protein
MLATVKFGSVASLLVATFYQGYPDRNHNLWNLVSNTRLGEFVDRVFPIEFKIKDITDTDRTASYLDLPLEIGTSYE